MSEESDRVKKGLANLQRLQNAAAEKKAFEANRAREAARLEHERRLARDEHQRQQAELQAKRAEDLRAAGVARWQATEAQRKTAGAILAGIGILVVGGAIGLGLWNLPGKPAEIADELVLYAHLVHLAEGAVLTAASVWFGYQLIRAGERLALPIDMAGVDAKTVLGVRSALNIRWVLEALLGGTAVTTVAKKADGARKAVEAIESPLNTRAATKADFSPKQDE